MKLAERVDMIEGALVKHLEESGEIRTDLRWLKKAFWTLTGLATTGVAGIIVELIKSH